MKQLQPLRRRLIRWLGGCSVPTPNQIGNMHLRRLFRDWTKEEVVDAYLKLSEKDHTGLPDYFAESHERRRLESLLRSEYHTDKDLNRAKHMADLEQKCKQQGETIAYLQACLTRRNRELFATRLIVNCTGCEEGAPYKSNELTEERVQAVERIATRLRRWWNTHLYRKGLGKDAATDC